MNIINLLDTTDDHVSLLKKEFARDVMQGLSGTEKKLSSKYLYDDEGSKLFKRITELDEYYLTRTECSILQNIQDTLPKIINKDELDIAELGVGDGHKSAILVKGFVNRGCRITYYPIDISAQAFELLKENFNAEDTVTVNGIIGDYMQGLDYTSHHSSHTQLVMFLGSNIGNFHQAETLTLLKSIRRRLKPGDYFLIGFDLKKDIDRMMHAYNDSEGITREFNLNLLRRINRELGGEFDTNTFQHLALYNPRLSAMESHLLSLKKQQVAINALNLQVNFEPYEPIHLEFSFKFNESEIDTLCRDSGFHRVQHFFDSRHYFVDSLWQVKD